MRVFLGFSLAFLGLTATPAQAAKILILTDPMTLERRMVVIDEPGPDRIYMCAMPPAVAGCKEVTPKAR
ncbi:hypothetical protein GGQ97_001413 [Sphingomonas kaistensis]|uniref:Uncharacterized protein n=1 Tax=Sphingomonas kaistensis TaxID=298708 RepID=A0A7X5Y833_9SPHN|nr:hypothetical protein [Sphingomonas kaistensis]NJC05620.1 hypothetical protein [Sphingomonas kaistensis]